MKTQDDAAAVAGWLEAFSAALGRGDTAAAAQLFLPKAGWRDILALTWHFTGLRGRGEIAAQLHASLDAMRPGPFRLDPARTPPQWVERAGERALEAFVTFDTAVGRCRGVLRLQPDPDDGHLRAWTLSTTLHELIGHEEHIGARRPTGPSDLRDFGASNWLDHRREAVAYADRSPTVVVIGAGQAGLGVAARLGVLGIDTLVVERSARIGDNWRQRYHSLTLHNEVFVNDLPYMPFPPNWPVYIAKDKLANWLESYAEAMEINCWTGTEFVRGSYDEAAQRWSVQLRRADGTIRALRPRHVVLAIGASPIPYVPDLPGLDSFAGEVVHSGEYRTGAPWKGRRALVLGTGTSGHDVAQDLHACGAQATLVQRSPTYVCSLKEGQRVYQVYQQGLPVEECDQLLTSMPLDALVRGYHLSALENHRQDAELLRGLQEAGFRLDFQDYDTGFQMRYHQRGGGYYFNVGCSQLIIERKVGLLQWTHVERIVPEGLRMRDGRIEPAALLVLATGYRSQQEVARKLLGDEIADRLGPVWGFDSTGELRNMWKRTPQKGLWFIAGSLAQCRIFSRFLALQIKACEAGLIPLALPARYVNVPPLAENFRAA